MKNKPEANAGNNVQNGDGGQQNREVMELVLKARVLSREWVFGVILITLAVFFALFSIYTSMYGIPQPRVYRSTFLTLGLIVIFLMYPLGRKNWRESLGPLFTVDILLIGITLIVHFYTLVNVEFLQQKVSTYETLDMVAGTVYILIVLEATRRALGWAMPLIVGGLLIYAQFSSYFFGFLKLPSIKWVQMVDMNMFTTIGLFGTPLQATAVYVVPFLIFGGLLLASGGGKFYTDLATALTYRSPGGAAKASVISSAMMGMLSGSSMANVVTTGSVTIPLMKKVGFRPVFAAAVETLSSTAGQITPPIMGATAFVMAEFLNVPFLEVAKAALIPVLLYYISIYIAIDLEVRRLGIPGLESGPSIKEVFRQGGQFLAPLVVILTILVLGYSPVRAALFGIVTLFLASLVSRENRMTPLRFLNALEKSLFSSLIVIPAVASAGIIIGVVMQTGLGVALSSAIVQMSGGYIFPMLVLAAVAGIILGAGMTTVAIYVVLVAFVAPALVAAGIEPMAAHMFAFYYGVISFITPPVALAAYAAAGIAGSPPMQTAVLASKIGVVKFIIPFMFVYSPALLFIGAAPQVAFAIITAIVGVMAITCGTQGWIFQRINILERGALLLGGFLLMYYGVSTDLPGLLLVAAAFVSHKLRQSATALGKVHLKDEPL